MRAQVLAALLGALAACGGSKDPGTTGTWRLAAPMLEPRAWHAMVVLPSGQVLVSGGFQAERADFTKTCIGLAELYDPVTGTWRATAPMLIGRCQHAAVLLEDGRVLVAGGYEAMVNDPLSGLPDGAHAIPLRSAELFDPATESWAPTGEMGRAHEVSGGQPAAHRLGDGRVLFATDWWEAAGAYSEGLETQLFDPATGTWSEAGPLPSLQAGPSVLLPSGEVLTAGGWGPGVSFTRDAARFRPDGGGWQAAAPLPGPALGHVLVLLGDGRVLAFGGCARGDDSLTCDVPVGTVGHLYDPTTGAWSPTRAASMPRYRGRGVTLPSGRALLVSGNTPFRISSTETDPAPAPAGEIYDPWLDAWLVTPVLPHYLQADGAVALLQTGEVMLTGGTIDAGPAAGLSGNRGISTVQLFRE